MEPATTNPTLPPELQWEIFEMAGRLHHPTSMPSLILVAQRGKVLCEAIQSMIIRPFNAQIVHRYGNILYIVFVFANITHLTLASFMGSWNHRWSDFALTPNFTHLGFGDRDYDIPDDVYLGALRYCRLLDVLVLACTATNFPVPRW
ncbi:hypothetical protein B0H11DRAFT_2292444 [Mycena galericulata]|nr:hypothetical protein B0H11DRAFT_2292444 [Mycena galericulata]